MSIRQTVVDYAQRVANVLKWSCTRATNPDKHMDRDNEVGHKVSDRCEACFRASSHKVVLVDLPEHAYTPIKQQRATLCIWCRHHLFTKGVKARERVLLAIRHPLAKPSTYEYGGGILSWDSDADIDAIRQHLQKNDDEC